MVSLSPDQILNLIIGFLFLIPAYFLYRNYEITKITDFLLFAGVFVASFIGAVASVLAVSTNVLIFYQLNVGMINLTFLLLFLHGVLIRFETPPRILLGIALGYFAILTVFIGFWKLSNQPEEAFVLFAMMQASVSPAHPSGAGLKIGDTIIYSSSYYFLGLLFWLFCIIFLLWAYTTVEMVKPTESIIRARQLWITTWVIDLIWATSLLPIFPQIEWINVLVLVANGLIIYIALKYPESTLLSNDQIVRYQGLYDRIVSMEDDKTEEGIGMNSLVDYLQTLPDDLVDS